MAIKGLKDLLFTGRDILWTGLQGSYKILMAQIGDAASSVPGELVEVWQHIGFASRPPKPNADGKSSQGITLNTGHYPVCIATRDARYNERVGALGDGETCIYAAGENGEGQARVMLKGDSSINLYTSAAAGGTGMGVFVTPGSDSVLVNNASGMAVKVSADGVEIITPNGAVTVGSNLQIVSKGKVSVSGTNIVLGGPAAQAVLTVQDLPAIFALITQALATITPGPTTTGGATAAAAISAGQASVIASASQKRTVAE